MRPADHSLTALATASPLAAPRVGAAALFSEYVERVVRQWLDAVRIASGATVAEACRQTGLGRAVIYNAQWALDEGGATALRARAERVVRRQPHYVALVEREAARVSLSNPSWGRKRIAKSLTERGFPTSPSRVRRVLVRCGLVPAPGGSADPDANPAPNTHKSLTAVAC